MRLKTKGRLVIESPVEPEIIHLAINPENQTLPEIDGVITSRIDGKSVITDISGEMTLGRFINTIDDVFKAAMLALNILNEIED